MARTGDRGGSLTRRRISETATRLFLERGFDAVTVADVAAQSGVSKVTVFGYFPRKEDLLLDRAPDAIDLFREAIRGRGEVDVLDAILQTAVDRTGERHPLLGLGEGAVPFFRLIAASPALRARGRELTAELEHDLGDELRRDRPDTTDADLVAALVVAALRVVLLQTAARRMAGESLDDVAADQPARLRAAFAAIAPGLRAAAAR